MTRQEFHDALLDLFRDFQVDHQIGIGQEPYTEWLREELEPFCADLRQIEQQQRQARTIYRNMHR